MKRFSIRFGVALAVVLGVGTFYAGRSGAQQLQVQERATLTPLAGAALLRSISQCNSVAAAATLTMGAGSTGVSQVSPLNYGTDTCNRYVVDINVPSTSTPPGGYQPQFSVWGKDNGDGGLGVAGVTQGECSGWHADLTIYKKANGSSSFTQIYSARYNGSWVGGDGFGANSCHSSLGTHSGNAANLTAPAAGQDVYRVAVRSYTSSALRKVQGGTSRVVNPPAK